MTSAVNSASHIMVRKTPLPPATCACQQWYNWMNVLSVIKLSIIPIGPFNESTQPGMGSWNAGTTIKFKDKLKVELRVIEMMRFIFLPIDGRTMQTGRLGYSSLTSSSASLFVYVYVFGWGSISFWPIISIASSVIHSEHRIKSFGEIEGRVMLTINNASTYLEAAAASHTPLLSKLPGRNCRRPLINGEAP